MQPDASGFFGEQVFGLEPVRPSEPVGSISGEQHVVRAIEHVECNSSGVADPLECGNGSGGVSGSVHDGCIEFDVPIFVGQAPVADGRFVRVVFNEFDSGDDGIERVDAVGDLFEGQASGFESVLRSDGDRMRVHRSESQGCECRLAV